MTAVQIQQEIDRLENLLRELQYQSGKEKEIRDIQFKIELLEETEPSDSIIKEYDGNDDLIIM